eukprot:SAG11_NODE_1008_length_6205_cov_3.939240_7_plen_63_part_00
MTKAIWLHEVCLLLRKMAHNVTRTLHGRGFNYTMAPSDFSGVMIQGGYCKIILRILNLAPGC